MNDDSVSGTRFAFVCLDVPGAASAMNATHSSSLLRERRQPVSNGRLRPARIPLYAVHDQQGFPMATLTTLPASYSSTMTRTTMLPVELRDSFGIDSLTLVERLTPNRGL
jgi:hypothetical protein